MGPGSRESLNDNTEGVYYLANLQVESLPLYKPNIFEPKFFPKYFSRFSKDYKLPYVFKILEQLFSRLDYYWVIAFSFYEVFTINGNVLYYESHYAC